VKWRVIQHPYLRWFPTEWAQELARRAQARAEAQALRRKRWKKRCCGCCRSKRSIAQEVEAAQALSAAEAAILEERAAERDAQARGRGVEAALEAAEAGRAEAAGKAERKLQKRAERAHSVKMQKQAKEKEKEKEKGELAAAAAGGVGPPAGGAGGSAAGGSGGGAVVGPLPAKPAPGETAEDFHARLDGAKGFAQAESAEAFIGRMTRRLSAPQAGEQGLGRKPAILTGAQIAAGGGSGGADGAGGGKSASTAALGILRALKQAGKTAPADGVLAPAPVKAPGGLKLAPLTGAHSGQGPLSPTQRVEPAALPSPLPPPGAPAPCAARASSASAGAPPANGAGLPPLPLPSPAGAAEVGRRRKHRGGCKTQSASGANSNTTRTTTATREKEKYASWMGSQE
jgi:hypothetical protein